jgi:hypothetical protein
MTMVDTAKMFRQSARMIADITTNPLPLASGLGRWLDCCDKVAPEQKSPNKALLLTGAGITAFWDIKFLAAGSASELCR